MLVRVVSLLVLLGVLTDHAVADECTISYKKLLLQNRENLARLKVGMGKADLISIMTDCVVKGRGGPYTNPFRTDVVNKGRDSYEVLYYLTRRRPPFTGIKESQAVPVVLKNGAVVGWGKPVLYWLMGDHAPETDKPDAAEADQSPKESER